MDTAFVAGSTAGVVAGVWRDAVQKLLGGFAQQISTLLPLQAEALAAQEGAIFLQERRTENGDKIVKMEVESDNCSVEQSSPRWDNDVCLFFFHASFSFIPGPKIKQWISKPLNPSWLLYVPMPNWAAPFLYLPDLCTFIRKCGSSQPFDSSQSSSLDESSQTFSPNFDKAASHSSIVLNDIQKVPIPLVAPISKALQAYSFSCDFAQPDWPNWHLMKNQVRSRSRNILR